MGWNVESKMESLVSSRGLSSVTQAVKVLQLGDFAGPTPAYTPEPITSRTRGGLQRRRTDEVPLKRGGFGSKLSDSSDLTPLC